MARYKYGKKVKDCNGHVWDDVKEDDKTQWCKRCGNWRTKVEVGMKVS